MTGNVSTGVTINFGWCPGCRTLHRITGCPDNHPDRGEYCVCCEAISAEAVLGHGAKATT